MKNLTLAVIFLAVAFVLVALVAAQTSNSGSAATASGTQTADATLQRAKKLHAPPSLSGDEAYKQNCTRCHNEVPKLDSRRTTTIMRHMRVRSNLTKDETEAILEYLKE